ncbi:MAG: hypothetical protein AAFO03_24660 [Bacteroidota bacterium]
MMDIKAVFQKDNVMNIKAFIMLLAVGASVLSHAQSYLTINGGQVVMTGNVVVLENTNFVNDATFEAQDGTVIFKGSDNSNSISGTNATAFNNLTVDKSSETLWLASDIEVDKELEMVSGIFDLDSCYVTLGTDFGILIGEDSTTYIMASDSGEIIKVLALDAPNSANPGNMGIEITSTQNLGSTTVKRGHVAHTIGSETAIERYFSVEPTNNTDLEATVKLYYLDHELNTLTESTLDMYRLGDNDEWIHCFTNSEDDTENYVEVIGQDILTVFTLGKGLLKISAKALLAGAYDNAGLMTDDLRSGDYLPTAEPYAGLGFSHSGAEAVYDGVFDRTSDDAVVDWILLELRDKDDKSIVIATRAALLQKDGDIVDMDGTSSVTFDAAADDYYLVVQHRNHLGVMSTSAISISETTTTYDFTTTLANTLGESNGILDLGDGYYALYSGDADGSGQVQNTDISPILTILGTAGYLPGDLDMNGQVQNSDIQNLLQPYIGKGEQY